MMEAAAALRQAGRGSQPGARIPRLPAPLYRGAQPYAAAIRP